MRFLALSASVASAAAFHLASTKPEQLHMAAGSDVTERVVSFVTQAPTNASCRYGNEEAYMDMYPAVNTFEYNAFESAEANRTIQMHSCHLGALYTDAKGTTYYYQVGTQTGDEPEVTWSETQSFYVFPNEDFDVTFGVYGDLGNRNHQIVPLLKEDLAKGAFHAVLHVGDAGYNLDEEMGLNGDFFKRMMQPVAASVPYMMVPGNHENDGRSYSQFTNRFEGISQLSDTGSNWYYSWEVANAKIVMFNSELWYDTDEPGIADAFWAQYAYLNETLLGTDREQTPWLIAAAHRPLYCSNVDDIPDCTSDAEVIRQGFTDDSGAFFPGVEDLFQEAGVDLFLTAHEHSYERTFPVYNGQVDSQANHTYVDAKAPVHIVTGAGGCRENYDYYDDVFYGPWSVIRSSSYGYGLLRVVNETSLHWSQYLSLGDAGTDDLWMHKSSAAADNFWPVPERKSQCSHYAYAVCASAADPERDCVAESHCKEEHARGETLGAGVEKRWSRIPDRH